MVETSLAQIGGGNRLVENSDGELCRRRSSEEECEKEEECGELLEEECEKEDPRGDERGEMPSSWGGSCTSP